MKKLIELAKRLYAIRWVDRALWTVAELGIGWATVALGGTTVAGVSAASVLFVVKELVAAKLAAAGGPIEAPPAPPAA